MLPVQSQWIVRSSAGLIVALRAVPTPATASATAIEKSHPRLGRGDAAFVC